MREIKGYKYSIFKINMDNEEVLIGCSNNQDAAQAYYDEMVVMMKYVDNFGKAVILKKKENEEWVNISSHRKE